MNYNIYGIKGIHTDKFIYIGMTERTHEERWAEHRLAIGGVYKKSGSWGKSGDVRNPDTPYGMEAAKPLYCFIREQFNGLDNENIDWEFVELDGDDKRTEDAWINWALYNGHQLFNMKKGEGEFITPRKFNGDYSQCENAADMLAREAELAKKEKARYAKHEDEKRKNVQEDNYDAYCVECAKYKRSVSSLMDNLAKISNSIENGADCADATIRFDNLVKKMQDLTDEDKLVLNLLPVPKNEFNGRSIFDIANLHAALKPIWQYYFALADVAFVYLDCDCFVSNLWHNTNYRNRNSSDGIQK